MEYIDRCIYRTDYEFLENMDLKCYYHKPWTETQFREHSVTVLRAARPIAYVAYRSPISRTLHIARMGVHPLFQRAGRGKHLLDFVIGFTNCTQFTLMVPESAGAGLGFAQNCGHRIISSTVAPKCFGDEDGIYFRFEVSNELSPNQA